MARRDYGDPYDPALRQTELGKTMYNIWRRVRRYTCCKEWDYFPAFYEWALDNGYEPDLVLRKRDESKPFSPKNFKWCEPGKRKRNYLYEEKWIADWNKAANRLRKHFGLPPLEGTDYGD